MKLPRIQRKLILTLLITSIFIVLHIKDSFAVDLKVDGLFQLQYENADGETSSEKINELFIRRLKLSFTGKINEKVSLVVEPEYGKGEPPIKNAYLVYKTSKSRIYAGNHFVPFSAESLVNDKDLMFVERSLTSELAPERNVGVSISRKIRDKKLLVQGGIWSSNFNADAEADLLNDHLDNNRVFATDFTTRENGLLIGAARIDYVSKGHDRFTKKNKNPMEFGLSYYLTLTSPSEDGPVKGASGFKNSSAYEIDFLLSRSRFDLELEYTARTLDWWRYSYTLGELESVTSQQSSYTAQVYIPISKKWSLAARYEFFEYDSKNQIIKGYNGQEQDKWITVGVNYYLKNDNTKVQLNYISKDEEMPSGGTTVNNNTALIQATVYF